MRAIALLIICATACVLVVIMVIFGVLMPYRYSDMGGFPLRINRLTGSYQMLLPAGWTGGFDWSRLIACLFIGPTVATIVVCIRQLPNSR